MDYEQLNTKSEDFDEIVEDIKQRNLSRNSMPKIIVGTGLSIIYGIPGMKALAKHLEREINKSKDLKLKELWDKHSTSIKGKGLEAGLANLMPDESILMDEIKILTAKHILKCEEKLHETILEKETGFCKLLKYLSGTVSSNNGIIDIMTPNYDRVIELICDKLGIDVITGFAGNMYCRYDRKLLKQPADVYNCKRRALIRLFKPHGSINWINKDRNEYLINNYSVLKKNAEYIEIVTPGGFKYKEGLTNKTFMHMREDFNELLRPDANYSLLFYGYGFNDDHFDTALYDSFQKNVLILAREVKAEVIEKALENKSVTVFYHENKKDYMIYKSKKYMIDLPLWNIDQFADTFLG